MGTPNKIAASCGFFFEKNDATCRDFTTRATVGVNTQVMQSLACRDDEGDWVFVR